MGLLLSLTGQPTPATYPTPARMLAGPWQFTWTADWSSAAGNGKEYVALFVLGGTQGAEESLELHYAAGVVDVFVGEAVLGARLTTPLSFSSGQTITFYVDPVAKKLRISGATTGNGVFTGTGANWWASSGSTQVTVGSYPGVANAFQGPSGGTFTDVLSFDASLRVGVSLAATPSTIKNASAALSVGVTVAGAGDSSTTSASLGVGATLTAVGASIVNASASLSVGVDVAAVGASITFNAPLHAAFLSQLQALLPPGQAWSRAPDAVITSVLKGFVPEFARVQERAEDMLREFHPDQAVEMLPEYEEANGLPDPCFPVLGTIAERQTSLIARLRESAGHNPADYIAIATAYGLTGTTVTRRPFAPFVVGESSAGERCYDAGATARYIIAYMPNLVSAPNDFGTYPWHTSGTTSVTTNVANGPDGTAGADRLTLGNTTVSYDLQWVSGIPKKVQFSVWLRSETTNMTVRLYVTGQAGGYAERDVIVDRRWRRFEIRGADDYGVYGVHIGGNGNTVLAWGACVGEVSDRYECRISHVQQAHSQAVFRVIGDYPKE